MAVGDFYSKKVSGSGTTETNVLTASGSTKYLILGVSTISASSIQIRLGGEVVLTIARTVDTADKALSLASLKGVVISSNLQMTARNSTGVNGWHVMLSYYQVE